MRAGMGLIVQRANPAPWSWFRTIPQNMTSAPLAGERTARHRLASSMGFVVMSAEQIVRLLSMSIPGTGRVCQRGEGVDSVVQLFDGAQLGDNCG